MAKRPSIEIEIGSFLSSLGHRPEKWVASQQAMSDFLDRIVPADKAALDAFGVGEYHREKSLDSAPNVILAAAAA